MPAIDCWPSTPVRFRPDRRLTCGWPGAGAELALSVAALGDRQQVQDNFALVEHIAPRARTEQTFRGIASGRARVAFNGKIAVREGAAGTDSRQSLRGLLAGPEAEIDVRPQLEIYTDDVRCSHGATAGKLDDNMLFYLLSRGLVCRGGAAPPQVGIPRGCGVEDRNSRAAGGISSTSSPARWPMPPR